MSDTVSLTERAAKRINQIVSTEPQNKVLRLSVEGGGCSGFQYKFELVPTSEGEDHVIERSGATLAIDPVSMTVLGGSEVDYVDDLIGAAFKINNPNATAGCGCGTSFTI